MLSFLRLLSAAIVIAFGILLIATTSVESCNQMVCGPVVSKCLLTQSCKCDSKNCTCCKDCYHCLSTLFLECCSCVGRFLEFITLSFSMIDILYRIVSQTERDTHLLTERIRRGRFRRSAKLVQCTNK